MKTTISYSTQISITNDAFYSSYSFKILMHLMALMEGKEAIVLSLKFNIPINITFGQH